ncbi:MAG: hypothetical protein QI223_10310 [Candidatus Korarchaeota archaeon]|nr:hypothetical protein [Candidatus Korarchaeota archaeon]
MRERSLKWVLLAEMALSALYMALTRSVFLIYLADLGLNLSGVSYVSIWGGALTLSVGAYAYRRPRAISRRVRLKLLASHLLERICWIPIALGKTVVVVAAAYSAYSAFQALTTLGMNLVIFGSFDEEGVQDVVAGRISSGAAASIVGMILSTGLLSLLKGPEKFEVIFFLGSGLGVLSTGLLATQDLSHLEGIKVPERVREGERIFAASAYQLALASSGALFSMSWIPYLIRVVNYPDYLVAAMTLVGTATSMFGAPIWRRIDPRRYKLGVLINAMTPVLVPLSPLPVVQFGLYAAAAFSFNAASLLGTYLFAKYNRWLGSVRSSALTLAISGAAQLGASGLGLFLGSSFELAFALAAALKFAALALSALIVPEVAVVPPHLAKAYANAAYGATLMGYRVSVAITRETLVATLRMIALTLALLTLYIIYRIAALLLTSGVS